MQKAFQEKTDVIKIQFPFCLSITFLGLFLHLFISYLAACRSPVPSVSQGMRMALLNTFNPDF